MLFPTLQTDGILFPQSIPFALIDSRVKF